MAANKKKGDVGTKQLEGEAIQETARINADQIKEQVLPSSPRHMSFLNEVYAQDGEVSFSTAHCC